MEYGQDKYKDIINMSRPAPSRPRMDRGNRAKIFAPFAALRGYDEVIGKTAEKHLRDVEGQKEKTPVEQGSHLEGDTQI